MKFKLGFLGRFRRKTLFDEMLEFVKSLKEEDKRNMQFADFAKMVLEKIIKMDAKLEPHAEQIIAYMQSKGKSQMPEELKRLEEEIGSIVGLMTLRRELTSLVKKQYSAVRERVANVQARNREAENRRNEEWREFLRSTRRRN